MILLNTTNELGDVFLINYTFNQAGIYTFDTFDDSTIGENVSTYFNKEYRYSSNNIDFTTWQSVSSFNIEKIEVSISNPLYLEFRYTVTGTVNAELTFNNLTILGNILFEKNKSITLYTLKVKYHPII